MKRALSSESSASEDSQTKKEKTDLLEIEALEHLDEAIQRSKGYEKEIAEASKRYYVVLFQKTMRDLSFCSDIFQSMNINLDSDENFYKVFSIAKAFINCNIQIKRHKSFEYVMSVATNIISRGIHNSFIKPLLINLIPEESLNDALTAYQFELNLDENESKLQNIAYLVQSELENRRPFRVPHPLYNVLTRQLSALSRYLIYLMQAIGPPTQ